MINSEAQFLQFLDDHAIAYQRVEHPPVYTCDEAEQFRPSLPGVSTKNLFLRGEKPSHFYLVMTACEKKLDLKALGRLCAASKLHFASEAELLEVLGVTPGAVTVLGVVNDRQHRVELLVDEAIWEAQSFLCHPLVNTATLLLSRPDLLRFFDLTGHVPKVIAMPPGEAKA